MALELDEMLLRWRRSARGPIPRLSLVEVFSALYLIEQYGPLGRYELASFMHENQGVIRGLLERLLEHKLVESSKAGASITHAGSKTLRAFLAERGISKLQRIEVSPLVSAQHTYGSHLRQAGSKATRVIEQRDIAVRFGAEGALTILCTKRGLTIPPDNESLEKLYPKAAEVLKTQFSVREGDVILLAFARDEYAALAGVLAVSLSVAA